MWLVTGKKNEQMLEWNHGLGVFFEFYYLRISINAFLCNPNFIYSKSLLFRYRGHRQSIESH